MSFDVKTSITGGIGSRVHAGDGTNRSRARTTSELEGLKMDLKMFLITDMLGISQALGSDDFTDTLS